MKVRKFWTQIIQICWSLSQPTTEGGVEYAGICTILIQTYSNLENSMFITPSSFVVRRKNLKALTLKALTFFYKNLGGQRVFSI